VLPAPVAPCPPPPPAGWWQGTPQGLSWLRKVVKACDDNDVSEGMGLYQISNLFAGDVVALFIRNLPGSDIEGGQGALGSFPAAVNWLLSTYTEPHALGLAQDKFSRVTLVDNGGAEAFAARLQSLAELRGNIHSKMTMNSPDPWPISVPTYGQTPLFTRRRNGATSSCRPTWQESVRPPRTSWRGPTEGPPVGHRGKARRRREPEASRSATWAPRGMWTTRLRTTRS